MAEPVLGEVLRQHLASLAWLVAPSCWVLPLVPALPLSFGCWKVSAVGSLAIVEVEAAGWYWHVPAVELLVDAKSVGREAWGLEVSAEEVPECVEVGCVKVAYVGAWGFEISAEEVPECVKVACVEAWGFEISDSALLVVVEAEHVEAWHLQLAFDVKLLGGEGIVCV